MGEPKRLGVINIDEILQRQHEAERRRAMDTSLHVESDEEYRERMARRMRPKTDRWMGRVPVLYRGATLDQLTSDQSPEQIRQWLDGDGPDDRIRNATLFLAGPVGTGKTYAAYAAGNHAACAQLVWAEAWNAVELLDRLLPGQEAPHVLQAVLDADLLILDDLAAPKVTDWALQTMYRIADRRVNDGRRQIITTNGSYDDLVAKWGAPTMDRFAHHSTSIVLRGESRRVAAF